MGRKSREEEELAGSTRDRILNAARTLVTRDGWDSLTVSRVAAEAGVYSYAIHYYFGSKRGLMTVLIDGILEEQYEALRRELAVVPSGEKRLHKMITDFGEVGGLDLDLLFFETFPATLRDPALLEVVLGQYDHLRSLVVELLSEERASCSTPGLVALASLWLMVYDGLAIQRLTNRDDAGYLDALALFENMVRRELHELQP